MPTGQRARFEDITETTGTLVTPEGAEMMYTRYSVAKELAYGKRVLELGCGSGQGFGIVARSASLLVGGDLSRRLLRGARSHYRDRVRFVNLSAESLPFADGTFDVVLFFEASYYVSLIDEAFREIARVVPRGGIVLFVNANPERHDFVRSPYSIHYHTAEALRAALEAEGFGVTVEGAFPVECEQGHERPRWAAKLLSGTRRLLDRLGLVPRTLRGRARLKRLVYRKLTTLPAELPEGFAAVAPRIPLGSGPVRGFKVIYVTARKTA